MYAVIKTGGKQHKVVVGEKLKVELIAAEIGSKVTLSEVLMVANGEDVVIGTPIVAGATVEATVVNQGRHKKVRIFKMQRRKHYQRRMGHRQYYTELQIDAINN